jgi:hypothetical protein
MREDAVTMKNYKLDELGRICGRTFCASKDAKGESLENACEEVCANLRIRDRLELERFLPTPPLEQIRQSTKAAERLWTFSDYANTVALAGVARIDRTCGLPWLVATDAVYKDIPEFLRFSKYFESTLWDGMGFELLLNLVDSTYDEALRWLEWLGYQRGLQVQSQLGHWFRYMFRWADDRKEPEECAAV